MRDPYEMLGVSREASSQCRFGYCECGCRSVWLRHG